MPPPLGDPEVKVIDIEFIFKFLFINMLTIHGHVCIKFYEAQKIETSACEMGKHQFRRAMLSGDSSYFLHVFRLKSLWCYC